MKLKLFFLFILVATSAFAAEDTSKKKSLVSSTTEFTPNGKITYYQYANEDENEVLLVVFGSLILFGIIYFFLRNIPSKGEIGERKVTSKIESLIDAGERKITSKTETLITDSYDCYQFNGSKIRSQLTDGGDYHQFDNVILKTLDGTTEIDHILVSPFGIFVIETKDFSGWIFGSANQKRWTQSFRRSHGLFGTGHKNTFQFQNPLHQNYKHVKAVQNFLRVNPKFVFNVVVFVGDSEFMTDMPENVMELHDLLPYIESHTERILNNARVEELCQKLKDYIERSPITQDDHMRNLEQNMLNPICPRCGIKMVLRTVRNGSRKGSEFWGCSNYPSCKAIKHMV